jgi:hypothetical protein
MEKPKHGVFSLVRQEQRITLQTRKYQMGSNDFWMSTICSSIFVFYIIVKFIYCEKANLPFGFYIPNFGNVKTKLKILKKPEP